MGSPIIRRPWHVSEKSPRAVASHVLRFWAAGRDSQTIADALGLPQADVCRIVAAEQDRRHARRRSA